MIRGPQVFHELQNARSRIQENVRSMEQASKDFDAKMDQLVSQRANEFLELAKHYLPELTLDTVERSVGGVRNELLEIFQRKQNREQELDSSIDLVLQTISQAQTRLDEVTEALNEKAQQRDKLQEVVSNQLKQIPEYENLTNEAAKAENRLTQNEDRFDQVKRESDEKLPSYDQSRLFRYLYDRKFGTLDYTSKGMTRRIDRWLAKYIGFTEAKRSYDFMKMTPKLMEAELERRRAQFNELMELIESMEAQVEQEVGLTDVVQEGERLGEKRDNLVVQIEDENQQLERFTAELNALRESKGRFFDEALATMKGHLEQTEEAALKQKATETAELQDDKIVDDIVEINNLIGNLQPEILMLVGQRRSMLEKQQGLDEVVRRFRSSNFDSNRSVFPENLKLEKIIDQYLNNELDSRSLWKTIRQQQKFQESWAQQTSTDILNDPSAQIVLHTMLDLAAEALKGSARRSVYRRNSGRSGGFRWPSMPSSKSRRKRSSSRRSSSRRRSKPRRSRGGFTSGDGF